MLFPDSYLVIDGGTEYFVDEISGKSDDVFSEQEGDRDKHGDDDNDLGVFRSRSKRPVPVH